MERIAIIGCGGSGKSSLARELGRRLDLPVIHLDRIFWKSGWVESVPEEFDPKVGAIAATDRWIIDGNYSRTYHLRLPRADTIVWLDLPRHICLWRVMRRAFLSFGRTRADMAQGCPERVDPTFLRWVWEFPTKHRPRLEERLAANAGNARILRLTCHREMVAFLEELDAVA
jgi:adenylate kinase family enzyme